MFVLRMHITHMSTYFMYSTHIYTEQWTLSLLFQVAQLHHELNLKDELLQFYTNAAEESEEESSSSPTLASFPIF